MRAQVRREQPLCPECLQGGHPRGWDELDHITPLFKGGTNDRDNLVGLCKRHHDIKTTRDLNSIRTTGADASGMPLDEYHPWKLT